jgi:exodeoxyribonuclease V gamma subunit
MAMKVNWCDKLEKLADLLFDEADADQADPFQKECVVVNSPVMAGWLKQHFLYDRAHQPSGQRVLANWEFQNLYPFVNDWLDRMEGDSSHSRDATLHPYSKECLRWRIDELLRKADPELATLTHYIGKTSPDRRRFFLASQLAQLFDDYQNYRPDMLCEWQQNKLGDLPTEQHWQPYLWKQLIAQEPNSYLKLFLEMREKVLACDLSKELRCVRLFGITSMPIPYLYFFQLLSKTIPVHFYLFNPSKEFWFDDKTERALMRELIGKDDVCDDFHEGCNPLVASLGKGCQSFLSELLDRTEGDATDPRQDESPGTPESLLQQIQEDIRINALSQTCCSKDDDSLRINICHSPVREVEVLRDHLYHLFDTAEVQPRNIQVLVGDMATYAPYIDALFSTSLPKAKVAIPYVIADRPMSGAGQQTESFLTLLRLPQGRFPVSEVLSVLETPAVREAFHLDASTVDRLKRLIRQSGIRWGRDSEHLEDEIGCAMDASATWRRGLDRLLMGYAMGRFEEEESPLVDAGKLGKLKPVEEVEGDIADAVGALGSYFDSLCELAQTFTQACSPAEWKERLMSLIERFYRTSNENYKESTLLRKAVQQYFKTAEASSVKEHSLDVMIAYMETTLKGLSEPEALMRNSVLFTSLGTMRPTPRPYIYLLGMNDGAFPRRDNRLVFDLLAKQRRRSDRSHRLDDRLAFLEALMSARKQLTISYVGRSDKGAEIFPPSTVVSELRVAISRLTGEDSRAKMACEHEHLLQAFNHRYFSEAENPQGFRSYSASNCEAARAIQKSALVVQSPVIQTETPQAIPFKAVEALPDDRSISLDELQRFFKNPASVYFKHALKARLDSLEDVAIEDVELFEAEGLAKYERKILLLDHSLDIAPGLKMLQDILRERGLSALGSLGEVEVERSLQEMSDFLQEDVKLMGTVENLLKAQKRAESQFIADTFDSHFVSGRLTFVDCGETPTAHLLFIRPSSLKAKDRISAWLAHLLACSTGKSVRTVIKGNDSKPEILGSVEQTDAIQHLKALIALFVAGHATLLPIACETSYAYFKALKGKNPTEISAKSAARGKWEGGYNTRAEGADPYLRAAWGTEGPLDDEDFSVHATAIWSPYFDSLQP